MEEMQAKLEQYRLRKRRRQKFDSIKEKIIRFLMPGKANKDIVITIKDESTTKNTPIETCTIADDKEESDYKSESDNESTNIPSRPESTEDKIFKYTLRTVYFLFWTTLYIIAIELKFGIVFLMLSALVGIYLNTRTGPRKGNEISAYSVFNKNCESIDGTLKAEQFERDLFFRADVGK